MKISKSTKMKTIIHALHQKIRPISQALHGGCKFLLSIFVRFWMFIKSCGLRRLLLRLFISFVLFLLSLPFLLGINPFSRLDVSRLTNFRQSVLIFDANGNLATLRHGAQNRVCISVKDLSKDTIHAFIATEDTRFFQHSGLDLWRLGGAIVANLRSGKPSQGASTITQQLIKNCFLSNEKTYTRKVKEAILSIMMEQQYTKNQILEMYLNSVYFGKGAYGIEAAAAVYFNKHAKDLELHEAALLAGILRAPNRYSPDNFPELAKKRRATTLARMHDLYFITAEQETIANDFPLPKNIRDMQECFGYYTDEVLREAQRVLNIPNEDILSGGYRMFTSLNPQIQARVEAIMADDTYFPKPSKKENLQGAIILTDPQTGGVLALVGGRKYQTIRGFNRATQMLRQPGSAIKPILVYAPAIEECGYSPAHFVLDQSQDFGNYRPENSDGKTNGWVTIRYAVERSLNIPAVRVLADIGISRGKEYCYSVGITFTKKDTHLALALGGFERGLSPKTLCGAYMPFANGGTYRAPWLISRIEDAEGHILYSRQSQGQKVLSEQTAYIMTHLLSSVTQTGTGKAFGRLDVNAAGKTGTVDDAGRGNKDAWMAAYTQDLCGVVWMGYDSGRAMPQGSVGGNEPAKLLAEVFKEFAKTKALPETPPQGVRLTTLRKDALADLRWEAASPFDMKENVVEEVFMNSPAKPPPQD